MQRFHIKMIFYLISPKGIECEVLGIFAGV